MPIAFRCLKCGQKLSISSRRAGTTVNCPACREAIQVPASAEEAAATLAKAPSPPTARAQEPSPVRESAPLKPEVVEAASVEPVQRTESEDVPAFRPAPLPSRRRKAKAPTGPAPKGLRRARPKDEEDEFEEDHVKGMKPISDAIDMTAMVDVTFLLLIFFMVTASFAAQKVMETSPPEPDSDSASARTAVVDDLVGNSIVVEVDSEDQIKIDDVVIHGLPALKEVLSNKRTSEQKNEVLIMADYGASHGVMVSVADCAVDVNMQKIRRSIRKEQD